MYKVWSDLDFDCLNTREEVLKKYAKVVMWKNKCAIHNGVWVDAYTGILIKEVRTIDIDHVIPLEYAHNHGLSPNKRVQFGNDEENLLITIASLNRSKGSKPISVWMPRPPYLCQYAKVWSTISRKYDLKLEQSDITAIRYGMSTCNAYKN